MPNCTHCHQPQTAALVICPECYRALTERTVSMETDKLIEAQGYWWCAECHEEVSSSRVTHAELHDACGHPVVYVEPKDPIAVLRAQLAEKDKQLSDARNELCQQCGKYHMAHKGACDGCRWRGPQEAGEVVHEQQ